MAILVSDTSILIELERGGLLEASFSLDLMLAVPDLLYQVELENENGPYLRELGLAVLTLAPNEVALAQTMKNNRPNLSNPDCFALSCALRQEHILLTGDKNLRNEAKKHHVETYGLLWLLDLLEGQGLDASILYDGLTKIAAHPRCRLPKEEVSNRLSKWDNG